MVAKIIELKGLFQSVDARFGFCILTNGLEVSQLDCMAFNIADFKKTLKKMKSEVITYFGGKWIEGCHDYMYIDGVTGFPIGIQTLYNSLAVLETMGYKDGYIYFINENEPYFMTGNFVGNERGITTTQIVLGIAQYWGSERVCKR
ncbi:MAG: hypothetical protein M0R17_07270 [Candidatus Omnitrophica bacterium]|jgi:hypothetical protein|nr:hypothetical protein [Candidatus Omnitrophota bacterium]